MQRNPFTTLFSNCMYVHVFIHEYSTYCVYIVFYRIELMFVESVMQIVFLFMQQTALLRLNTASLVFNVPYPTFIRCSMYTIPAEKHYYCVHTTTTENVNVNHFPD